MQEAGWLRKDSGQPGAGAAPSVNNSVRVKLAMAHSAVRQRGVSSSYLAARHVDLTASMERTARGRLTVAKMPISPLRGALESAFARQHNWERPT